MKQFLIELLQRIGSDTPEFFKAIRKYALWIACITGIIVFLPEGVKLPDQLVLICSYIFTLSSGIAGISTLPKKDIPQK